MSEEESKKTQQEDDEDVQIMDFGKDKKKKDKKDKKEKKEKKDKKDKGEDEEEDADDKEKKDKKKKDKKEKKEKKDKKEKADDEDSAEKEDKKPEVEEEEKITTEVQEPEDENADDAIIDFGAKKKSKKSKKDQGLFDLAAEEGEQPEEDKKAKKSKGQQSNALRCNLNNIEGHESFTYEFLLTRVSDHIQQINGGETQTAGAFKLIEPQCGRTRTKSTWANFDAQVVALDRKNQHILDFFMSELGCVGNIGSNGEMILVGGYQAKHYLRLIRKYIEEYVRCKDCRGYNTTIEKEEKTRLTLLKCKTCLASRTVQNIESRFRGVKRGERRAAKQAA